MCDTLSNPANFTPPVLSREIILLPELLAAVFCDSVCLKGSHFTRIVDPGPSLQIRRL